MKAKAFRVVQRLTSQALVEGFESWRDNVMHDR